MQPAPSILLAAALATLAVGGASAAAQNAAPAPRIQSTADEIRFRAPLTPGVPPGFQRVLQGVGDLNTLGTSLYSTETTVDLRGATGFEQVYRGPDGRFYRFDGAIGASFPQSEYYMTRDGVHAAIPGGTIFHIGPPWTSTTAAAIPTTDSAAPVLAPNRTSNATLAPASNLVTSRGASGPVEIKAASGPSIPGAQATIATDDAYRDGRLAALLGSAADR